MERLGLDELGNMDANDRKLLDRVRKQIEKVPNGTDAEIDVREVMRKIARQAVTFMLVGFFLASTGCSRSRQPEPYILWMNDIAHSEDGDAFESAFALDTACQGLKFYRWTNSSVEERLHVLDEKTKRWDVRYGHAEWNGRDHYALWMTAHGFSGLEVSIATEGAADAAHKACTSAKEKGGSR